MIVGLWANNLFKWRMFNVFLMEVREMIDGALEAAFCFWSFGFEMGRSVRPVIDAMQYDVLNCRSLNNPEPHNIVVHGKNGFCKPVSSYLSFRLGNGYVVGAKSGKVEDFGDGHYYLDVDWYEKRVKSGGQNGD